MDFLDKPAKHINSDGLDDGLYIPTMGWTNILYIL